MSDGHGWEVGDIVLAYTAGTGEKAKVAWVGYIVSFGGMNTAPRVRFWNQARGRFAPTLLPMSPEGLTFIGRLPDGVDL